MLFERISVMAPAVEENSIGKLHFLKKVSFVVASPQIPSAPAMSPAPAGDCMEIVLSMSVLNLFLLPRLLKVWKSLLSTMSVTAAVAPLHCLSR